MLERNPISRHLFEIGLRPKLGDGTPRSLIFTVWYFFTKCFGLRARDEHRKMTLGDITLHKAVDGSEYIQFSERNSKMRDGTCRDDSRATAPKIFATGGDRDPVQFYKSTTGPLIP